MTDTTISASVKQRFPGLAKRLDKNEEQSAAVGAIAQDQSSIPTSGPKPPAEGPQYTVVRGDSLSKIARKLLGDGNRWPEIYELNKNIINDPNLIYPGQELKLPTDSKAPETTSEPQPQKTSANKPETKTESNSQPESSSKTYQIPPVGTNPDKATMEKILNDFADRFGIPRPVLKAVAFHESSWRQYKDGEPLGGHNSTSTDWGVMQINDRAHPSAFPQAKTDILYNIEYGCEYLSSQYKRYGNWKDAIAAYNYGHAAKNSDGSYKNQKYVNTVLALLDQYGGANI